MAEQENNNNSQPASTEGVSGSGFVKYLVFILIVLIIAGSVLIGIFGVSYVKVNEVGLRVWLVNVPGLAHRGAQNADILDPGYNIIIPGLHTIVVYDKTIQSLEMTYGRGPGKKADDDALTIMTAKGNQVMVDATILYRVMADKVNMVREEYSTMADIKEKGIKPIGKDALVESLGQIPHPEDFYNSKLRSEKAEAALKKMNDYFQKRGIEIVDVLIRDFSFREDYEMEILRKIVAVQLDDVIKVITQATAAQAEALKTQAEIEATFEQENAVGTAEVLKIDAEAERYSMEQNAKGDLAILQARAEGLGQLEKALQGTGGQTYVGLEYAKTLEGLNVIVLPSGPGGINPLDIDSTLKLFKAGAER